MNHIEFGRQKFNFRWQAFLIMVILATIRLSNIAPATPPSSSISGLPNLFGVCVYSFMCHHSLPGLVTPISNKKNLYSFMLGDYCLILAFYFLLAYTGIFAFTEINDLYTLNFQVIIIYDLHYKLPNNFSNFSLHHQILGSCFLFTSSLHSFPCLLSAPTSQSSPSLSATISSLSS